MAGNDKIEHACLTDVGVRRSQNQDSHAVLLASNDAHWLKQGHVFLVADGMGAHAVGELASELAATIIPLTYQKYADEGPEQALRKAFIEANTSIHERGRQNREFQGMGTTSSLLLLRPEGGWISHVGDSRVYRVRDGLIEQLSFDHSLLWELARRQKVKPERLQNVPSNVIVRSMGPDSEVQPDIEGPHPLRAGDTFLLCSDGLSGQVSDHEIGVLAGLLPPAEACQALIDLANLRGGPDNITVVIARVREGVEEKPAEGGDVRKAWYRRVPWPYGALVLGVVSAVQAVMLGQDKASGTGAALLFFAVAVVFILIGMAGLVLFFFVWDTLESDKPRRKQKLKVYTSAVCRLDRSWVDKLKVSIGLLEKFLREKGWEADWKAFAAHQQQADALLAQNDIPGAFRYCWLALHPLAAALHLNRTKADMPNVIWEKITQ